jgi:hypothetical protein
MEGRATVERFAAYRHGNARVGHCAALRRRCGVIAGAVALLAGHSPAGRAQEVAAFRLTGVEGYASVRYLRDEYATRQLDAASRQDQADLREELFLMTHSYVYHPSFLALDLGAGPVFQRARTSLDGVDGSSSGTQYNLSARASFLRDKPYRGSLFYERLNPTVTVAPGSVVSQENKRYGFDLSLAAPLRLDIDGSRVRARGTSPDRIVDNQTDQFSLRASQRIGGLGLARFRYDFTGLGSSNGSPNLPIQSTTIDRNYYQIDTHLRYGEAQKYDLYSIASFEKQTYAIGSGGLPERNTRRLRLDLRGRESQRLNVFATYDYSSTDQTVSVVSLESASAGMSYDLTKELLLRLNARAQDIGGNQFDVRSRAADALVQYMRPLGPGMLNANYSLRYEQRDQQASAPQANIIGEAITLAGTTPVALARQRVVAGSVVVNNAARTQTFVEGIDYLLTLVGLQTRVQRIVGGSIVDGQDVAVDYAYDPGGTYAATQTDQTLNVDWSLGSYVNLYVRYVDQAPELRAGAPTTPLNAVQSTLYGTRMDMPLNLPIDVAIGGLYQREIFRETISPYRREQAELYVRSEPPFGSGQIRLGARRVNQDFERSPQDVRLVGYDLSVLTRHAHGVTVSANATYERDTGAPLLRTRQLATARAQWRYRRADLTMDFVRSRESQDGYERRRSLVQILLRRDF